MIKSFLAQLWFTLGAMGSLSIAVLHIVIIIIGSEAYSFFGAGKEIVALSESGSPIPPILTSFIVLLFTGFAIYGFVAAKVLTQKLPFMCIILIAIATIYLLRSLLLPILWIFSREQINPLIIWSSLVSFMLGMFYLIGILIVYYIPPSQREK